MFIVVFESSVHEVIKLVTTVKVTTSFTRARWLYCNFTGMVTWLIDH